MQKEIIESTYLNENIRKWLEKVKSANCFKDCWLTWNRLAIIIGCDSFEQETKIKNISHEFAFSGQSSVLKKELFHSLSIERWRVQRKKTMISEPKLTDHDKNMKL